MGSGGKFAIFVRLSKDCPYRSKEIVYIFGVLTRIVNLVRYLCWLTESKQ